MARQETLDYRVRCIIWTQRSVRRSSRGYLGHRHDSYRLLLAFVVEIEECLVFDDRPTQGGAVLIVVEGRFGLAGRIEIVARIQRVVAEIFTRGSVQGVGSALGHNVNDCARTSAVLRLEV